MRPVERSRRFSTKLVDAGRGRVLVPVPFDPDVAWGVKSRHHVAGTIAGRDFRGVVEARDDGHAVVLGPSWCRDRDVEPGRTVDVAMHAEGVQRADLAPDLAAALEADPEAGAFFDSLAQFYRNAYLRWIDGTKRRPEVRAARIAEVVDHLRAGYKQRPEPDGSGRGGRGARGT
jgi:hypothetical protein